MTTRTIGTKERETTESGAPPRALREIPPERVVEVDVRGELRAGGEPFGRIMAARKGLPAGGALRVRAIFEPVPLYQVMARQGLDHWTERLADDDWAVTFYPATEAAAGPGPATTPAESVEDERVVVLDVRGLEPPEPMVRTLAALETLPPGKTLVQVNVRTPEFLLPRLDALGFTYEIREQEGGPVRVFIRRADEGIIYHDTRGETDMPETSQDPIELDVRPIPPRDKHPTIFATFDALAGGESFVLVNDHDPFPLRHQFEAVRKGQYTWAYLEQGPREWRVRIARR